MKQTVLISLALAAATSAAAQQPERGFRGFAEWSNSVFRSDNPSAYGKRVTNHYSGVSAVFGYQCNSWLFTGGGLDLEYSPARGDTYYALFADGRTDLRLGRLTPFIDLRVGYNMTHGDGIYLSPSVGYRFTWGRKVGANISVGYTLNGTARDIYTTGYFIPGSYMGTMYLRTEHSYQSMFCFRAGIDF